MTAVDYPGTDTPDVTFSYTRLGRRNVVTQSGVATWTFNYDDGETGETNTLRLVSETIAGTGGFYSKTITRDYDAIGRDAGFHIGSEYDVNYYPATDGRFERITGPGLWAYGVEYARLANSDLIEHVRYKIDYSVSFREACVA